MNRGYFRYNNGTIEIVKCDCCKSRNAEWPMSIPNPISESWQTFHLCRECQYYILNVVEKAVNKGVKPKFE